MHFMRSLFRNKLVQDGFEVRKLIKITEEEKKRVKTIFNKRTYTNSNERIVVNDNLPGQGNMDSAIYYRKVMNQTEKVNVLINKVLPGDSIAFAIDSFTAGLFFDDHLQVIYYTNRCRMSTCRPIGYRYKPNRLLFQKYFYPERKQSPYWPMAVTMRVLI